MTQEEKSILLRDLCARLPYNIKVRGVFLNYNTNKDKILYEECDKELNCQDLKRYESLKPYLKPMSSMTEEEKNEMHELLSPEGTALYTNSGISTPASHYGDFISYKFMDNILQYLNKHHFDYHGLIPMGLALPATEDMYK